ncbi:helix-turn-helix domain-containing protein [Alkaliphilus peptidifermentans]|uniref:Helix-turn-helix domain-containing protein n=1 Tax=Alkaliphilus peptidifermentans DSM 18978 TaxID=1120976 RepID=A0A1G5LA32_9FIRM|nr:helix-turn-helix domain-containing protein [Alkaliphilus peptidifermentans]SCZ09188.1 Helix-turn-helix domain-containing protein [Alkaliphilus peptidifermentans DSM 18978]
MDDTSLKETFYKAQSGDEDSIKKILEIFHPLLHKNSFINGSFNEDCYQELSIKLIKCIKTFKFSSGESIAKSLEEYLK